MKEVIETITECQDIDCDQFPCDNITEDGKEFHVRPKGTLQKRINHWRNINNLIGKMLTVEFQEWTPDGKPFHCRGVVVRDYE